MDWFRQVPIGQYVDGSSSWLRHVDPRLKIGWVLMFLLTPLLAGTFWRFVLVLFLFGITFFSCLPTRVWWRSTLLLLLMSLLVGSLAMTLPASEPTSTLAVRPPNELPNITFAFKSWQVFQLGPLSIDRRSAELGIKSSTLIFTLIQSVNLMLITTSPEDLVWALRWTMSPLQFLGIPIDRMSFQLLLSLRFIPLVQEEIQNLLRSVAIRAVNLRKLGLKTFFGLVFSVGERLLANILLRAEQGADAFVSRGARFLPAKQFKPKSIVNSRTLWLNVFSLSLLVLVIGLRWKYGA